MEGVKCLLYFVISVTRAMDERETIYWRLENAIHQLESSFYHLSRYGVSPERMVETFIFPGTYWCGPGNTAPNDDILGQFRDADACCRAHDKCPDIIDGKTTKYGLTNDHVFPRLSCYCEEEYYYCLTTNRDIVSEVIKTVYFSLSGSQCFKFDYPIESCAAYNIFGIHCVRYHHDYRNDRAYQWFDVQDPEEGASVEDLKHMENRKALFVKT